MAKMGRPKAESPKKMNVSFRMTEAEYKKLAEYATEHNLTITEVLHRGVHLLYEISKC